MTALTCCLLFFAVGDGAFENWEMTTIAEAALPDSVGTRLDADALAGLKNRSPKLPFSELTLGVKTPEGALWLGSPHGLMLLEKGAKRWRLFHSRRWLPDDYVEDLAVTAEGDVVVRTKRGTCRLLKKHWESLDAKMDDIHAMLRKHHLRMGFVTEIDLKEPGTLEGGYTKESSDNDGLWTCLYIAAEAFRFGATGDETARQNAWESLKTMMFLEEVTGIPGFAARSVVPGVGPNPKGRYGGVWYKSADGKWWWKGDTSSDEVDGHYFAYAIYYDIAATEEQKKQIREVVTRMTDHILDHDYYYVGPTGKHTTWGFWGPKELNQNLDRIIERGLNSLEILSHLKVAEHITGNPRYTEAIRELNDKHAYAMNTVRQKILWPKSELNHSDDELAFVAYYPLLWYERDPKWREIYLTSIEWSFQIERPEQSPLFNLIYAAARQASKWPHADKRPDAALVDPDQYDKEVCEQWFRDVPRDTIGWTIRNNRREDIGPTDLDRFGHPQTRQVLPIYERLLLRWNANPYRLDGGRSGRMRGDGAFILLPYWMGKYHRLID